MRLFSSGADAAVDLNFIEIPTMKNDEFASRKLEPVVIMHGLLGSSSNFRTVAANPLVTNLCVASFDRDDQWWSMCAPR